MNIFSRIIEYIDFKGISKNEFSVKIGLSNSYMTKMEKSKGNVGLADHRRGINAKAG